MYYYFLLGEFGKFEDLESTWTSVEYHIIMIFFVFLTFLTVIVMLNLLIAFIVDSIKYFLNFFKKNY